MPKIKYRFSLTQEERDELEAIVAKGVTTDLLPCQNHRRKSQPL